MTFTSIMTAGYEFELATAGRVSQYQVSAACADDGRLCKVTIEAIPLSGNPIAEVGIDPQLFKQFAMPNVETLCRIAIAQAVIEGAFEQTHSIPGLTLDFAIEPWEGKFS